MKALYRKHKLCGIGGLRCPCCQPIRGTMKQNKTFLNRLIRKGYGMIEDNISMVEHVSIRLIPESEWNVPRCGTCFAHMGDSCARDGKEVGDFSPSCNEYDQDDLK